MTLLLRYMCDRCDFGRGVKTRQAPDGVYKAWLVHELGPHSPDGLAHYYIFQDHANAFVFSSRLYGSLAKSLAIDGILSRAPFQWYRGGYGHSEGLSMSTYSRDVYRHKEQALESGDNLSCWIDDPA